MGLGGTGLIVSAGIILSFYLIYRRIAKMAKAGSPLFKIGYFLYTKTQIGYHYYRKEVSKAQRKYNGEPHSTVKATAFDGLTIRPIPLSMDNYCYLIKDERSGTAVLVDPADPEPVQRVLESAGVTPTAILTTHKHWDHSAGNSAIRDSFPTLPVYGGRLDRVPGVTHTVEDGDKINFGELCFRVLHTPGHTSGHVVYVLSGAAYSAPDSLFSGDLLFLGGMGRMFEGSAATMLSSLDKVCALPDSTLLWPGHEYAFDNLEFAIHIDPDNQDLQVKYKWVKEQRTRQICTSPSRLQEEKTYNPFLRVHTAALLASLGVEVTAAADDALRAQALQLCRTRKDKFKYQL